MGDAVGLEAEPFDDLADSGEVDFFFSLGVGVVVAEVALAVVVACEAEVDSDGLAVADMEIAVWLGGLVSLSWVFGGADLWWEPGEDSSTGGFQMRLHVLWFDLLVTTRLMEARQEPFLEHPILADLLVLLLLLLRVRWLLRLLLRGCISFVFRSQERSELRIKCFLHLCRWGPFQARGCL